jgi:hypothetical protein
MAIAFKAKGGWSIGNSGTYAVAPTGGNAPDADDILIVVTESCNSASAAGTPSISEIGWSQLCLRSQGDGGAGVTTMAVYGKRAVGGEAGLWVTGTPNHIDAEMFVYSGCMATGTAWTVGSTNGAANGNGTMSSVTTVKDNSLVMLICTSTRDAISSSQFSSWTNSNLTSITEREDKTDSTSAGGGFGVADGFLASAGACGNSTVTIATSEQWCSVHIALAPDTAPAGSIYDDSVSIGKIASVSPANNIVMNMAATLARTNAFSDGNDIAMFPALTLAKVNDIPVDVQQILFDFVTVAKKDGFAPAVNAVMGALLQLDKKSAITIVQNVAGIVTKGYVTVIDFSGDTVSTTSYRAGGASAEDF